MSANTAVSGCISFYILLLFYFMCMDVLPVCVFLPQVRAWYELLYEYQKLNSGLPEEQTVLLTAEPPPQPLDFFSVLWCMCVASEYLSVQCRRYR